MKIYEAVMRREDFESFANQIRSLTLKKLCDDGVLSSEMLEELMLEETMVCVPKESFLSSVWNKLFSADKDCYQILFAKISSEKKNG